MLLALDLDLSVPFQTPNRRRWWVQKVDGNARYLICAPSQASARLTFTVKHAEELRDGPIMAYDEYCAERYGSTDLLFVTLAEQDLAKECAGVHPNDVSWGCVILAR